MEKQMVYILTGLPYAGKTTLRCELVSRFGFSFVSVDNLIDENNFIVEEMSQEDWNRVYSGAYVTLKNHLSEGKSVVVDIGNLKRSERDAAKQIAEAEGVSWKLIYVNTSAEDIIKRWSTSSSNKERGHLAERTLERAFDMFESPSEDEAPIIYNSKMDLNEWITENIG